MGRKILLADDSITIQKVVNLTFSDEGIDVVTVGNGELAVRKLNDVRPDIVLADIYMPGKNGYEVCEYIKTNPQFAQIPVLLLVGAFEPFDQAEALRVKADGHLTKPFESRALIATVTRLLAQAPVAATAQPAGPPQAQAAQPSWHSLPPDSTTTRLSPEMLPQPPKVEMPKVEPIRASPVPIEQLQPPIAPPPVGSKSSASAVEVGEKTAAYSGQEPAPPAGGSDFDFDLSKAIPAPPAHATAPLPTASPTSITTAPFTTAPLPTASPVTSADMAKDFNLVEEERMEELELPDEEVVDTERTIAYGLSALPPLSDSSAAGSAGYAPEAIDSVSPLELDEVEISDQQTAYQTTEAENQYEDITPLDLEPLEDIGYPPASQIEAVLEISPESLPMEELPSLDDEDLVTRTEPRLAPVTVSEPPVSDLPKTIEMASLPEPEVAQPPGPNFELVSAVERLSPADSYSDLMPAELQALKKDSAPALTTAPLTTTPEAPESGKEFAFELPEEVAAKTEAAAEVAASEVATAPEPAAQPEPATISTAEVMPPAGEAGAAEAGASVAITSIEQIPQHLIDEIVRRAIAKMSEDVVREIAWEVVPDLAELLIKKRLDQKPLG